jgi:biotin operon repressor
MYMCNKIVNCGNEYLGESIGISEAAVAKIIPELKKAGFIETSLRGRVRTIFPRIKTTKSN